MRNGEEEDEASDKTGQKNWTPSEATMWIITMTCLKIRKMGSHSTKDQKNSFMVKIIAVLFTLLALLTSNTFSHVAICSSMSWMSKNKLHTLILSLYNIANTVTESSHCHSKPDNLKPVNAIITIIIIVIVIINTNAIMLL